MNKYEKLTTKIATIGDDDLTDLFFEWKHDEDKKKDLFIKNVNEIISNYTEKEDSKINIPISDKDIEELASLFTYYYEPEQEVKNLNGFNLLHRKEILAEEQKNNFKKRPPNDIRCEI